MNSGGAHCLKYGVTTNNLLGVRLVTLDGEILDIGGAAMDAGRLRSARPDLRLRRPARDRDRSDRAPHSARRKARGRSCSASIRPRTRANASRRSSARASCRSRWNIWTSRAIHICENFAHAGYPLDVEAMLIIEVEGSEAEMAGAARQDRGDRQGAQRAHRARIDVGDGERPDLERPQIRVRRDRPDRRLHLHGRHGADRPAAGGASTHRRNLRLVRAPRRQCLPCRRRQHASARSSTTSTMRKRA